MFPSFFGLSPKNSVNIKQDIEMRLWPLCKKKTNMETNKQKLKKHTQLVTELLISTCCHSRRRGCLFLWLRSVCWTDWGSISYSWSSIHARSCLHSSPRSPLYQNLWWGFGSRCISLPQSSCSSRHRKPGPGGWWNSTRPEALSRSCTQNSGCATAGPDSSLLRML